MRTLDLCSGIGGMALGLQWAGFPPPVAFCEIEPYCRRVLARHWPDVPIHRDIRRLTADAVGPVDLITGGIPCQAASRAGRQRGAADDRWLWPEAVRLVEALRPRWILFENPPGIYDVGLAGILASLEGLGYANARGERGEPIIYPVEIGACAAGAPHIRQRVWIVASLMADADRSGRQQVARGSHGDEGQDEGWPAPHDHQPPGPGQGACHAEHATGERRREGRAEPELRGGREAASEHGGSGFWDGAEWLHCAFDGKWRRTFPGLGLLAHGVPERVARLRALGNSVVPQVVAQIGRAILAADQEA